MRLDDEQRAIVAELLALAAWHRTHTHCPRCGSPTEVAGLGWWRTCPEDGTEHYPRTDPAIIALLLDDEDNALLGRQARWPTGRLLDAGRVRGAGGVGRGGRDARDPEEVGLHPGRATPLPRQPALAVPRLPDARIPRSGAPACAPNRYADGYEIAEARWIARRRAPRARPAPVRSGCRAGCPSPTTSSAAGTARRCPTHGAAGSALDRRRTGRPSRPAGVVRTPARMAAMPDPCSPTGPGAAPRGRDAERPGRWSLAGRAPARPGRSPIASPMPCSPGGTRRGPGMAVTFTNRAAGEMRQRLVELGVPSSGRAHLPRRRAQPAAALLAAGRGRGVPGAGRQQGPAGRPGLSRAGLSARPAHGARPGVRDRVGRRLPGPAGRLSAGRRAAGP